MTYSLTGYDPSDKFPVFSDGRFWITMTTAQWREAERIPDRYPWALYDAGSGVPCYVGSFRAAMDAIRHSHPAAGHLAVLLPVDASRDQERTAAQALRSERKPFVYVESADRVALA